MTAARFNVFEVNKMTVVDVSITSVVISILQQRQQQLHSVISIKFHAYTGHYYARLRSAAKCEDGCSSSIYRRLSQLSFAPVDKLNFRP